MDSTSTLGLRKQKILRVVLGHIMEQIAEQIKAYNNAVYKSCIHDTAAVFISYCMKNIGIGTVKHWWFAKSFLPQI